MSIYPVRLKEWFPLGDPKHELVVSLLQSFRCEACRKKPRFTKAIAYHSLPYGGGPSSVWCSEKCMDSGKVARPDKRYERRMNRRFGKYV